MSSKVSTSNTSPGKPSKTMSSDELTQRNIALIAELESATQAKRTFTDIVVDQITGFCGRMLFVWVHIVWFSLWMVLNLTHLSHFDPYPFNLLTLTVSLEAIFLSTFILISQNRAARLSERRSHLDLQINLLSEQENTKMLIILNKISEKMGIADSDPVATALMESTEPATMLSQIEDLIEGEKPQKVD
jgi:uncharacterized membrane protein